MKIKKLTIDNHNEVIEFFGDEITDYYFIIETLIKNDYEGEGFNVFGEYEDNKLVSILMNNYNNITYYSKTDRKVGVYKDILDKLIFEKLSGPSKLMEKFKPYVNVEEDTLSYMGVVKEIALKRKYSDIPIDTISTEREIGMQYNLLMSTEEYQEILPEDKKEYIINKRERIKDTNDRIAYLSIDGEMVSSCATIGEGEKSAIVIGVVTNPKYRKKGYGTDVLIGLFNMLLEQGKYPYLFYNNSAARSVYKKIGMKEVCEWRVIFVKEK